MEVKILVLQFLYAIAGVESNHGQLTNHPVIENPKSIHYGRQAIGKFAAMPNTIKLLGKSDKSIIRFKNDAIYEYNLMFKYASQILTKSKGCPLTGAILWLHGPNYKPKKRDYNSLRQKKFMYEWDKLNKYLYKDNYIDRYCEEWMKKS